MNKSPLVAVALLCSTLAAFPVLTQAQEAVVTSAQVAPPREVSPRDLMTVTERFDMWRKMRAARTPEERVQLWAQKYAELQRRAAARGLVLREPGPRMMGGGSNENAARWGREDRMGMRGPERGGAPIHPPLAK